jgi:hypothetical protein
MVQTLPEYSNDAGIRQDLWFDFPKKPFSTVKTRFFPEQGEDNLLEIEGYLWYDRCKSLGA